MVSNIVSMFAQPMVQAMAAGMLTGVVAGTALVGAGLVPLGQPPSTPTAALLACPGGGPILARVPTGQPLLVTARSEDGTWLEVYIDQPGADRGWAPASQLTLQAPIDSLPVGRCETAVATIPPTPTPAPSEAPSQAVIATVTPTARAAPSPTARPTATPKPTAKPTPKPTPLPPPPTPGPTPDVTAPILTSFTITYPAAFVGSYYIGSLPCSPPTATVHVTVSDPSGLNWVRLYYRPNGLGTSYGTMYSVGGGTYEFIVDPNDSWPQGEVGLWVAAQDTLGNTSSQIPFGNPYSTSDSSLIWDPFCIT